MVKHSIERIVLYETVFKKYLIYSLIVTGFKFCIFLAIIDNSYTTEQRIWCSLKKYLSLSIYYGMHIKSLIFLEYYSKN